MKKTLLAIGAASLVAFIGACSVETTKPSNGGSGSSSGSTNGSKTDGTRTDTNGTSSSDDENGGGGSGSGGSCAQPTGIYDETRTVTAVVEPPGPDSPCDVGAYADSVDFSQPPPLNELPGCTKTRDEWSPNGCTHTVERTCESQSETCVETITFASDLSSYSGTRTCKGTFEGVDDSGPYTCKTTIKATRKR